MSKKTIFTGAAIAIITPMNPDGSVNFEEFKRLIDFQIHGGTDAIVVCGTTGEASTLSHEEHIECIRFVTNYVNKRVPVIAGTGSNCTETAIYLSKEAEKIGVDGLLVVSPYYNKATQNGLVKHFSAIANSVNVPIILYNIPGRTGVNIQPATVKKLVDLNENIVAVKDATGDTKWTAQVAMLCKDTLDIYSGDDNAIVPVMALGGKGVISVLSHIAPRETHEICQLFMEGKTKESLDLQLKYLPLINALFCEVNPIPVKAACDLIGFNVGPLRSPLSEIEDEHLELLKAEMKKVDIL